MEKELSKKEKNKINFLNVALEHFVKYGINDSKVTDIAIEANTTERTAFRYFDSKTEMILESLNLLWQKYTLEVGEKYKLLSLDNLSYREKIKTILLLYCDLYFDNKNRFIFISEAEVYLCRQRKTSYNMFTPPQSLYVSKDPLALLIKSTVNEITEELNIMYMNTFDSLLGFIQKMSIIQKQTNLDNSVLKTRFESICSILANGF